MSSRMVRGEMAFRRIAAREDVLEYLYRLMSNNFYVALDHA